MTLACGWLPFDAATDGATVVGGMGRALRVHERQEWSCWSLPGLTVGLLELPSDTPGQTGYAPAVTDDRRYALWLIGEAFSGTGTIAVADADESRRLRFRDVVLDTLVRCGADAVRGLDGQYQIVLWDTHECTLNLINDRYGNLPLYWARSAHGFAFAGGVRAVLMAPGVAAEPDPDALREAMTFGGFRLSDRTNVTSVKMLPAASVLTVHHGAPRVRRYWHWADVQPANDRATADVVEEAYALWRQSIQRRLAGSRRPGQTLSGGLDSRAILAEAAPRAPRWTAITYGLTGCDDARWARQATETAGVTWVFHPLYSGRDPDWLAYRSQYIQGTDGLIQLADLMHMEALPLQAELLDVHLSGYLGDVLAGTTYLDVTDADRLVISMPFYGTTLGWSWQQAQEWARDAITAQPGVPPRFLLYDHKFPQAINRIFQTYAAWVRVRKPFLDYALVDFFLALHGRVRRIAYPTMLRAKYPAFYAALPHQRTGMPVLTPNWRIQLERGRRFAARQLQSLLAMIGITPRPRLRSYHDDELFWRTPACRDTIAGTILRPGSICCEILGRAQLTTAVTDWFERAAGPAQVIGALYVYEAYHRDLSAHLRAARAIPSNAR